MERNIKRIEGLFIIVIDFYRLHFFRFLIIMDKISKELEMTDDCLYHHLMLLIDINK